MSKLLSSLFGQNPQQSNLRELMLSSGPQFEGTQSITKSVRQLLPLSERGECWFLACFFLFIQSRDGTHI